MYKIILYNNQEYEVTERQFHALVRSVFTGIYPDKIAQIKTFKVEPPKLV